MPDMWPWLYPRKPYRYRATTVPQPLTNLHRKDGDDGQQEAQPHEDVQQACASWPHQRFQLFCIEHGKHVGGQAWPERQLAADRHRQEQGGADGNGGGLLGGAGVAKGLLQEAPGGSCAGLESKAVGEAFTT